MIITTLLILTVVFFIWYCLKMLPIWFYYLFIWEIDSQFVEVSKNHYTTKWLFWDYTLEKQNGIIFTLKIKN